ncbi:hypothetical protein K2P47_03600 [Patescibacteria group bacterium]|nr:hypothetical protein [Patescibacteria group bacterium]
MMKSLEAAGLSIEKTGVGTDGELHTIRLKSNYVASICYRAQTDQTAVHKAGVWSNIVMRPELNKSQLAAIRLHLRQETKRFEEKMFDGQK